MKEGQTMARRQNAPGATDMQRNALAPGILGAVTLLLGVLVIDGDAFTIVRFIVAILALIVAWFAIKAHQWWWAPPLVVVAVVWNPVVPFDVEGQLWLGAQYLAMLLFIAAGIWIRTPRSDSRPSERKR